MVTTTEVEGLIHRYVDWLGEQVTFGEVHGGVEITLPYLDRHNDYLQIYVTRRDDRYLLTDDAYALEDLRLAGVEVDAPEHRRFIDVVLAGFGVSRGDRLALEIETDAVDFPIRQQNLIQAMHAIIELGNVVGQRATNPFREDVVRWLQVSLEIAFQTEVPCAGKSGNVQFFDFLIPRTEQRPGVVVYVVPWPTRGAAELLAFRWSDTEATRPRDVRAFAVLNDADDAVVSEAVAVLSNYGVTPVRWSERERLREALAGETGPPCGA